MKQKLKTSAMIQAWFGFACCTASLFTSAWAADTSSNMPQAAPPVPLVSGSGVADFSATQIQSIENIIHAYLVKNPEVLIEASDALRKKMEQEQAQKATLAIRMNRDALVNDPRTPVMGNPKGSDIIIEFLDYQCGHCKDMGVVIKNLIQKNPNLAVLVKDWPIFEGASSTAAKAVLAANAQGKYAGLHEALLAASNPLTDEKVYEIAQSLGLNMPQLKKDMESPAIANQIKAIYALAEKIGLSGTPVFVVAHRANDNMEFLPGATTEEKLQAALTALRSSTPSLK